MQKKFIKQEEYQKILPEEQLIFGTQSMISSISLPENTVFMALHGNLRMCGAQGTAYVVRTDYGDPVPLNIDAYSFNSDGKEIEIKGPVNHEHHWVPDIPQFIKDDAPEWVRDKVKEAVSESTNNS